MEKVVASTAKPISLVPSMAALYALLPICTCRTMFSRTTMASSINKPMHSDKAINVTMFKVKPSMDMIQNVPMMAIGSVRPVMMVERQELRNKNTINTVSSEPSIKVFFTLFTPTRIWREAS